MPKAAARSEPNSRDGVGILKWTGVGRLFRCPIHPCLHIFASWHIHSSRWTTFHFNDSFICETFGDQLIQVYSLKEVVPFYQSEDDGNTSDRLACAASTLIIRK